MGMIVRFVFPLIAYLATATVITGVAGYAYLRQTGKLDDERMFQIVSLIHGIDLEAIAEQKETDLQEVPLEEPSHKQKEEFMQITNLHFQAKIDDLENQRREFQDLRRDVVVQTNRYENFKDELKTFMEQRREEALETGLMAVRNQWQNLTPKKQTKELLKKMVLENRTDEVILLLNGMPSKKRTDILKTLDTPEDLDMLYKIQKQMLEGGPEKKYIDQQIKKLEGGNE